MVTFIESFTGKAICVPMLQRDYIQGLDEGIITPFLESLMNADTDTDLNYIYGYDEGSGFIPVDGQQRLITLWLLHLYVASAAGKADEFNVTLSFQSREYAADFASCLKEHIGECLSCEKIAACIEDASWFIKSWTSSKTVCAMLSTLNYIHRLARGKYMPALWERLNSDRPGISFSFLNMGGDTGLDDDIYLKMNGRGRALSVYENLKSWIDKRANDNWKHCIDNNWAELFWSNRQRKDAKAESNETDDEALHCFCNLLILYWAQKEADLEAHIKDNEPALHEYFDLNTNADTKSVLFERLSKGELPSLIWLERLDLVDDGFRSFAHKALNGICAWANFLKLQIGSADSNRYLYTGTAERDSNTLIYDLLLSPSSFGRTLPLLYAVIRLCELENENIIYRRLRTIRNLVLNSDINRTNLPEILSAIYKYASQGVLSLLDVKGINKEQLAEERIKGKIEEEMVKGNKEYETLYEQMGKMENSRFFRGRIICMFRMLHDAKDEVYDGIRESFERYSQVLRSIFSGGEERPVASCLEEGGEYILKRSLITLGNHWFGHTYGTWGDRHLFCCNPADWRSLLAGEESSYEPLRLLIKDVILPDNALDTDTISVCLHNYLHAYWVEASYETRLARDGCRFYLHFAQYPEIWSYMDKQRIFHKADNKENEIYLLPGINFGEHIRKMELRTFALYQYYKDKRNEYDEVFIWEYDFPTCFTLRIRDGRKTDSEVAIDIKHYCREEDDYYFDLFESCTDNHNMIPGGTEAYFKEARFDNLIEYFSLTYNENERYIHGEKMSRQEIIETLAELTEKIKAAVKPE